MSEMDAEYNEHYSYSNIFDNNGVTFDHETAMNKFYEKVEKLDVFQQLISKMFPGDVEQQKRFTPPLILYILNEYCTDEKQSLDDWIHSAGMGARAIRLLMPSEMTAVRREIVKNLERVPPELSDPASVQDEDRNFRTWKLLTELRPGYYYDRKDPMDPKHARRGSDSRADELENKVLRPLGLEELKKVAEEQQQNVKNIRQNQVASATQKQQRQIEKAAYEQERATRAAENAEQIAVLERVSKGYYKNRIRLENIPAQQTEDKMGEATRKLAEALRLCDLCINKLEPNGINIADFQKIQSAIKKLQPVLMPNNVITSQSEISDFVNSIYNTIASADMVVSEIGEEDMAKIKDAPILPITLSANHYERESTKFVAQINAQTHADLTTIAKMQQERDELKQQIRDSTGYKSLNKWVQYQRQFGIVITFFSVLHFINWGSAEFGHSIFDKSIRVKTSMNKAAPPGHNFTPNDYNESKNAIEGIRFFLKNVADKTTYNEIPLTREQIDIFLNFAASFIIDDKNKPYTDEEIDRIDEFRLNVLRVKDDVVKRERIRIAQVIERINKEAEEAELDRQDAERDARFFEEHPPLSKQVRKGGRRRTKKHVKKHRARTHKKKHNKKTHKRRANKKRRKTMKKRR